MKFRTIGERLNYERELDVFELDESDCENILYGTYEDLCFYELNKDMEWE